MVAGQGGCLVFEDSSVLGRMASGFAKAMAVLGGLALIAMVVMVVVSIIGRALIWAGLRPIPGDYELVSVGMGFAIFAFLPWVHLERGHAMVTLLTDSFPKAVNTWILVVTDLMMLLTSAFIAWRLYDGTLDKFRYGETTLLLGFPMGWAYALALVGAIAFVLVAVFVLGRSLTHAVTGRSEPGRMRAEL